MNTRMDRTRLNIGAYTLRPYARTERHIKEIAECGIDFMTGIDNDRNTLDLFEKYGLGAILNGVLPPWWGGDGKNAGMLAQTHPIEKYEDAAKNFPDHPAVWGFDVGDEPSALDFPYYGQVIAQTERLFPNQFAFLNLYPNYGVIATNTPAQIAAQLGTDTYEEYIRRYCERIPADYISYDHYLYSGSVTGHFENLRIAADACRDTGKGLWIVLQVNSFDPEKWITENQLRFQAYTAMAFGAENILWACYTAGWWHNHVLDKQGEKTRQYDRLKQVNSEIRTLAGAYMDYRRAATYFVAPGEAADAGIFREIRTEDGKSLLAGHMTARSGGSAQALMLLMTDDPYDTGSTHSRLLLKAAGLQTVTALGGSGEKPVCRLADGTYAIELASNEGILIQAK